MHTLVQIIVITCILGLIGATPLPTVSESVTHGPHIVHKGWATYYNSSVGMGSCGWQNEDSELVAAIGTSLFQQMMIDDNPNHSSACGKTANVSWSGKNITVKVVDRCNACGQNDIDLTPAAFQQLSALATGKLHGTSWRFN